MTIAASDVLRAFDALPLSEKQQVAAEILRRSTAEGDLSGAALDELAEQLFGSYDAEEGSGPPPLLSEVKRKELQRRIGDADTNPGDVVAWEHIEAEALARFRK